MDQIASNCVQRVMWIVLVAALIGTGAETLPSQGNVDVVARALVPLLRDARAMMPPRTTVQPGTLPPSPITGRNSALIAVTIGRRTIQLEQEVIDLIDRLLEWDVKEPLPAADREVVQEWIEGLRGNLLGRLAAREKGVGCDDACVIEHFTKPGPLFGSSREQQVETRNEVLLNTLSEAVRD